MKSLDWIGKGRGVDGAVRMLAGGGWGLTWHATEELLRL